MAAIATPASCCIFALALLLINLANFGVTWAARAGDTNALEVKENDDLPRQYPSYGGGGYGGGGYGGCPLCDSSVYSYCSHKAIHDSCCCDFPAAYQKPQQCYYYDCNLLYAKSCYEHSLIKNCCCNNPY